MAGAAPAFSYNYPERAPERPERPRVRVVPGQGTRTSTQTIPSTVVFMAKTLAVVLVVAALLCFARIAIGSATVAICRTCYDYGYRFFAEKQMVPDTQDVESTEAQ